jgi:hypothetical protein
MAGALESVTEGGPIGHNEPTLSLAPLDEFLTIVRRDLEAEDACILAPGEEAPEGGTVAQRQLPGDHRLLVRFDAPPTDLDAKLRRLDMLVASFQTMLTAKLTATSVTRPSPARSLHDELAALVTRAGAVDALVIDARSPVVWGAAAEELAEEEAEDARPVAPPSLVKPLSPPSLVEAPLSFGDESSDESPSPSPAELRERIHLVRTSIPPMGLRRITERKSGVARIHVVPDPEPSARDSVSERAIRAVRALPEMPTLHKGGHIHHSESEPDFGYVARSFAGIYVLVVVFREPFDELRAKRATLHALPIIERLVLALPPRDPVPTSGAVALARRRRRR